MAVELPEFLPLEEAARRYGVVPQTLISLVESGKIKAVRIEGRIAVEANVFLRESLWEKVKHLDGKPISMSDACEKYPQINFASLSRWVARGYIRVIASDSGRGRGRKRLLNEADVAYAALLNSERGKPGRKLFTPELVPH